MAKVRMHDRKSPTGFREVRSFGEIVWTLCGQDFPVAIIYDTAHASGYQCMDVRSGYRIVGFVHLGDWKGGWPVDKEGMRGAAYAALTRLRERYGEDHLKHVLTSADALPQEAPRITLKAAKAELKEHRMSITRTEYAEFRVTFDKSWDMTAEQREDAAHYTDDLGDAVSTGKHMAARQELTEQERHRYTLAA